MYSSYGKYHSCSENIEGIFWAHDIYKLLIVKRSIFYQTFLINLIQKTQYKEHCFFKQQREPVYKLILYQKLNNMIMINLAKIN